MSLNQSEYQAKKGSGSGLVLVRELPKQINAKLIIESQEGVGSVFKIKL